MKKQPYPLIKLTGGLNVSAEPSLLEDTDNPEILQVIHDKGLVKKDSEYTALGLPVLGVPLLQEAFYKTDGTVYQVMCTTTSVYYLDTVHREWLDVTPGVTVEDCEDIWTGVGGGASCSADVDCKRGTYSCKVVIGAGFTTGVAAYEDFTSANLSTYTHIHLWIKSSLALDAADVSILLDDTSACASPIETLDVPALAANTWTRVSIALAHAASDTAIISVGLKVNVDKGACNIYLDDIRAVIEFTGDEDNLFFSAVMNDTYIITNGANAIQKWTGGEVSFEALGGSPPSKATTICAFHTHLILGGTTETGTFYPQRIRWASVGTTETWSGGSSGYIDLVDTVDWIMHIKLLKGRCIVYKDYSFWELTYIGGTAIFRPELRMNQTGTLAPGTIVDTGEVHILYSNGNIVAFDGLSTTPLADDLTALLYETGTREISLATVGRATALYLAELNHYMIVFPEEGIMLKYMERTKSWSRFNGKYVHSLGYYSSAATPLVWSAATETWETIAGSWAYRDLPASAPTVLLGWSDGQVYEDDRVSYGTTEMTWVTKDFIFGHASRITEVRVNFRYGGLTIYYSLDGGLTYTSLGTFAYAADWVEAMKEINTTTQRIRFKITSAEYQLEIKWLEPWYIPRKLSKALIEE